MVHSDIVLIALIWFPPPLLFCKNILVKEPLIHNIWNSANKKIYPSKIVKHVLPYITHFYLQVLNPITEDSKTEIFWKVRSDPLEILTFTQARLVPGIDQLYSGEQTAANMYNERTVLFASPNIKWNNDNKYIIQVKFSATF